MKKYRKIILLVFVLLIVITSFFLGKNFGKEEVYLDERSKQIKQENTLSMMLETEAGSGNYEMTTASSWPTEGYVFNSELSKCENGGELSWDDVNKKVLMSGNVSDKCYVYFDVYAPPALAEYVISQYNGVQGNNNIYFHDSSLANGAGDNSYRYAGSSDTTNNYVCFGSNKSPCPEDNLYRIIGVFDGQVKLIKATLATSSLLGTDGGYGSDTTYKWSNLNTCPSDTTAYIQDNNITRLANKNIIGTPDFGCNAWELSDLNTINLNTNFLVNIGPTWSNLIEDTTWNVSGHTTYAATPREMYTAEITNATKTYGPSDGTSKIGLMYASDYGFAATPSAWTSNMSSYNSSSITLVNWMYMGSYEWTITPDSSYSRYYVFILGNNGNLYNNFTNIGYIVRPTFYLKSSVVYANGTGTQSDPIIIN